MPRGTTRKRRLDLRTNSRRNAARRPSLREALRQADAVARHRSNRRLARRRRDKTVQASIDVPLPEIGSYETDTHPGDLSLLSRLIRFLIGLLLLPLCIVTAVTLFQRVAERDFASRFWQTPEFFYFALGAGVCAGWLLSGIARKFFLYLYVLGHELTHVLFIYLSFGKVSGFSVGLDGGYVITNKSNILIALSPYFVPFWSLIALLVLTPVSHFYPDLPYYNQTLFGIIGATWCFHLLFTCWMIPRDQPDLKENETFFSLMLIILANIILLSALICLASPHLGWRDFVYNWYNNFLDLLVDPAIKLL
ncbi:MAG: hypothetical protein AAGC74_08645 [Verrucomicrobiota bacterium]